MMLSTPGWYNHAYLGANEYVALQRHQHVEPRVKKQGIAYLHICAKILRSTMHAYRS